MRAAAGRNRESAPGRVQYSVAGMDNGTLTDNNGRKADFRNVDW